MRKSFEIKRKIYQFCFERFISDLEHNCIIVVDFVLIYIHRTGPLC